ncbi:hypothetical protein TNCV_2271831 [Trichonephila clavipes]|nr:hypothetical protein TNCV_2271831 [Trichonephila clavipes]
MRNGSHKIHRKPKNHQAKVPSKIKTMPNTFFDSNGIIHKEFVPTEQTVTGQYNLAVLKRLMTKIRCIHP